MMAAESGFADWLKQNGFEEYIEAIIEEGGIKDKEGLKADFDEICEMLLLSNEKKEIFKAVVFTTNVVAVDDMQKFCEDCDIVQFKNALIKASYTHPKLLLEKTQSELDDIGKSVGMRLEYLCKFKAVVLERQQKIEFEQWCQNNGFGKFSQVLMKHGIKSKHELVPKSDSELDELCKQLQELKEKSEDKKEQTEKESETNVTMEVESISTNKDEEEELQREKLELKVQNTLKDIGIRLSKMQEKNRVHYRSRFENTLESLSSGKCKEHFQKLKDILGDMKTQSPEEFEIERIFLGLCGFEVTEVAGNDTEIKEETFEIYGSVDD
ncbi:hypothetical protein RFI_29631, partial [Reticulomyxa filosa]